MRSSRNRAEAIFRSMAVVGLAIVAFPSVAFAHAQLELSGITTTTNQMIIDFSLTNGGEFQHDARFATYSHSSGTSESRGLTYSVGGIDSVLDLFTGGGGAFIAQSDDLNTPPGNRDSEIGTPFVTHRTGYVPIPQLFDGAYQIRHRAFSLGTLGNGTFSMEARLFAPTVTIEAPQVPVGTDLRFMFFDGLGSGPNTMNINAGDNLNVSINMHTSTGAEIVMTGGSLNIGSVYHMSDRSGVIAKVRQSGGTSNYAVILNMATVAGSSALYELSGNATLTTAHIRMAANASSTAAQFIQSGTSTSTATDVTLGSGSFSGEVAEYNLNGGVLTVANNVTVTPGNIFEIAGGELRVKSLANVLVTNAADFHWSHGTIWLQNDLATEDTFGIFGATLTLTPGRVLRTTNAQNFNSAIVLDGGKLSVPNLAAGHPVQLKSGELNITGGGGLSIGPGGPLGSNVTLPTGLTVSVNSIATIDSTAALVIDGGAFSSSTLTNSGLIRGEGVVSAVTTNAATAEIRAQAGKTLTFAGANGANAGTINLQGGTAQFSQALTNSAAGQILGRGMISAGGAGLTNNGHIALSSGITDVFGDVNNNTASAARGVTVSGNADVTFWDDVNNTGVSLFRVSAGSSATFFGTYSGTGVSGPGNKYMEADVTPGASPATIDFGGNVFLGDNAKLITELGGTLPGSEYDQVHVEGNLSLDGMLQVTLIDGFSPDAGDSFDILDWGSVSGTFSSLSLPALAGLNWDTSQLYSDGVLAVVAPGVSGDYNDDGVVDAADYVIWRKLNGTSTVMPNDPNPLPIDNDQYVTWRGNYGEGGSGAGGEAVPEPVGWIMGIVVGAVACGVRWRTQANGRLCL